VGLERSSNQDNALVATRPGAAYGAPFTGAADLGPSCVILAVCDGMGGAAGGEVASSEAVGVLRAQLSLPYQGDPAGEDVAPRLVHALRVAARTIHAHARLEPALRGMGTTATVAVVADDRVVLGQVGDSRAYLYRAGALSQLTRDQSLAQLLIEQGKLTPEDVKNFVGSNVILQAVGTSEHVEVDIREEKLLAGDVLVLCSDGLSGPVAADDMRRILAEESDPAVACEALIRQALEAGGPDNATCIVAKVVGGDVCEPRRGG
jgi:serine/threonine protein phosphatase PrpC